MYRYLTKLSLGASAAAALVTLGLSFAPSPASAAKPAECPCAAFNDAAIVAPGLIFEALRANDVDYPTPSGFSCEITVTHTPGGTAPRGRDSIVVDWRYARGPLPEEVWRFARWEFRTGVFGEREGVGCQARLALFPFGRSATVLFHELQLTLGMNSWEELLDFDLLIDDPSGEDAACYGQFPEEYDRPRVFNKSLAGIVETAIVDQVAALGGSLDGCDVVYLP